MGNIKIYALLSRMRHGLSVSSFAACSSPCLVLFADHLAAPDALDAERPVASLVHVLVGPAMHEAAGTRKRGGSSLVRRPIHPRLLIIVVGIILPLGAAAPSAWPPRTPRHRSRPSAIRCIIGTVMLVPHASLAPAVSSARRAAAHRRCLRRPRLRLTTLLLLLLLAVAVFCLCPRSVLMLLPWSVSTKASATTAARFKRVFVLRRAFVRLCRVV